MMRADSRVYLPIHRASSNRMRVDRRPMIRSHSLLFLTVCCLGLVPESWAVRIEDLEPGRAWRLRQVVIQGNEKLATGELEAALLTQARPWYRFWSERPLFDPVTFREDLERLRRLYETRGFYH